MKEFLFVYRNDFKQQPKPTAEEAKATTQKWMDWLSDIQSKGNLVNKGDSLGSEGKVVKPNNTITDGPYTEIKELIGGYSIIKTDTIEEAAEIAKGCPILEAGGNVEVRELNKM